MGGTRSVTLAPFFVMPLGDIYTLPIMYVVNYFVPLVREHKEGKKVL